MLSSNFESMDTNQRMASLQKRRKWSAAEPMASISNTEQLETIQRMHAVNKRLSDVD